MKFVTLALTLIALLVPASAASAAAWHTDPGEVPLGGEKEAETFTGSGELTTAVNYGAGYFTTGPFNVSAHGLIWNEEGAAIGVLDEFTFETPVPTSVFGCTVIITNNGEGEVELPITPSGIWELTFVRHYSEVCFIWGIAPWTVPEEGSMEGTYNNETGCIEFVEDEHILVENGASFGLFRLNGSICIHGTEGTFTAI